MPYTTVVAGTAITASWGNANVRDQVVTPFASSAARASAITSPVLGMLSTLTDTHQLDYYDGVNWVTIADADAWTSYTPTWSTTGTAPSLGNGTLTGRHTTHGKVKFFMLSLTAGSTTTFGTGTFKFTLPSSPAQPISVRYMWMGQVFDSGPGTVYTVHGVFEGPNLVVINTNGNPTAAVTGTAPITFAAGDEVFVSGFYQS